MAEGKSQKTQRLADPGCLEDTCSIRTSRWSLGSVGFSVLLWAAGLPSCDLPVDSMHPIETSDPWGAPQSCSDECAAGWECLWDACQWREMLDAVNQARSQGANCGTEGSFAPAGPLGFAPPLTAAAQEHALTMAQTGCFSHDGTGSKPCPDGTPCRRIAQAGYRWSTVGENIALNSSGLESVIRGWLASPGHCANLLKPIYLHFGGGLANDGQGDGYYVQTFGAPGAATTEECP